MPVIIRPRGPTEGSLSPTLLERIAVVMHRDEERALPIDT